MKNFSLTLAGLIFAFVAIIHLARLKEHWVMSIGGFTVPVDWSIYGAVIAGVLALLMFASALKK